VKDIIIHINVIRMPNISVCQLHSKQPEHNAIMRCKRNELDHNGNNHNMNNKPYSKYHALSFLYVSLSSLLRA